MEESRVRCALFPLPVMPLPGERLHLHVFEPRYQELFNQLEGMELEEFGIPCMHDGKPSGARGMMRLIYVEKRWPDGCRDVVVECTGLFRVDPETPFSPADGTTYPAGQIAVVKGWKDWPTPEGTAAEAAEGTIPREGAWMAWVRKLPLGPEQRAFFVQERNPRRRNGLVLETLRIHDLVLAQERQRTGPWFPN
jgi:hypothetical protein